MINEIRLAIANFLQTNIINNHVIFLDLWSIIHIASALIIMILLIKIKNKNPFKILIAILLTWELFEFINYQILGTSFFLKERMVDVAWDIIAGISGGTLGRTILNHK